MDTAQDEPGPRHVFREGDDVLFVDRKARKYLVELRADVNYHTHLGEVALSDLIGEDEGIRLTTSKGHRLLAVKPTLADQTLYMPRTATVVYPKDLGAILVLADIFPGARVLEAGSGSGAVTIALMRAVGDRGSVFSYDLRTDMIARARSNVVRFLPHLSNVTFREGDVSQGFEERDLDRIILDLPEPWHIVPHASEGLVPGGILLSFVPTILQVHEQDKALKGQGTFDLVETVEVMLRPWSIGGRSVRPDHRMARHTGFITTARRCSPIPERKEEGEAAVDQAAGPDS